MNAMIIFFIRIFPFSPLLFLVSVLILRSVSPLYGVMHLETLQKKVPVHSSSSLVMVPMNLISL